MLCASLSASRTRSESILEPHPSKSPCLLSLLVVARHVRRYVGTCGLSQKEIGAGFGVRHFAVSKAVAGLGRDLTRDRRLARLVKRLTSLLPSPATAKS